MDIEKDIIDADFEEITDKQDGEQKQEQNYFDRQEEKINKTKEKLQKLLEKLQAQPPKETIAKKILRLRINRLRTQLNRSMTKFNIEYLANQTENEAYEKFVAECDGIRDKIEELEDIEDDLEYELEFYARKENYRGRNINDVAERIAQVAPRENRGVYPKANIKNRPRKSKSQEIQEKLLMVKDEIAELQEELEGKIASYREYKVNLEEGTKEEVNNAMATLKEQEEQRKKQQKEQLAITKPSIWARIRGGIKATIDKISAWNEKRKEENIKRSQKKDEVALEGVEEALSGETERQKFLKQIEIDDTELKTNIAKNVRKILDSKESQKDETTIEDSEVNEK